MSIDLWGKSFYIISGLAKKFLNFEIFFTIVISLEA